MIRSPLLSQAGGHAGEADLARFKTEAKTIARLQHPNIVAVYEVGQHQGKPFFSLELCTAGSLDRKLAGARELRTRRAIAHSVSWQWRRWRHQSHNAAPRRRRSGI